MTGMLQKRAVFLFVLWIAVEGHALMFSIQDASRIFPDDADYWDFPLSASGKTLILLPFDNESGSTFYGQNPDDPYAFSGRFRSEGSADWTPAVHNHGLIFNGEEGQGAYIEHKGALALPEEDASWEFWIKPNQITDQGQVIAQIKRSWQIKIKGGSGQLACISRHGDQWMGVVSDFSLTAGVWTHVIFTREWSSGNDETADYIYSLYIDGVPSGSESYSNVAVPDANTADMTLGCSAWDAEPLNGVIDDFRITRGICRRQILNEDNGDIFQNPHMGFAYGTSPHKYLALERYDSPENPPEEYQIVKLIIEWADIEPSPGQYDWSETDQAIQLLLQRGHSINARFLLSNGKTEQGVPDWIYDPPYNVGYIDVNNNCKDLDSTRHPYYWDSNFQDRARNILSRFVERYKTSDLSWVDVRIYGHCGEWDAGNNPFPWETFPLQSKSNVLHQLVDIYVQEFQDSGIPVVINTEGWEYANGCQTPVYADHSFEEYLDRLALGYAFDHGFGMRFDNIHGYGSSWEGSWMQQELLESEADNLFVVGETGSGWNPKEEPPEKIVAGALYAKMTSIAYGGHRAHPRDLPDNYTEAYELGMKNLGYRLIPSSITFPAMIQTGQVFSMQIIWENHAVGRLIKDKFHLRAFLKDSNGNVRWQGDDRSFDPSVFVNGNDFDPDNPDEWWKDGRQYSEHLTMTWTSSGLPVGTNDLYLAIVNDDDEKPAIRLAIDGGDEQIRYKVGTVVVTE